MENVRKAILQVNVICSEHDDQDPRKIVDENEYTGTCFRINPNFLKKLPFYSDSKIFFITNFHVCDDANERVVHLRTAPMGRSMFTAYVEAAVPKLDIAVLSIDRTKEHVKWFSDETPTTFLNNLTILDLYPQRISSKTRKVSTLGFPHGLQNQLSSGWLAGRGTDDEEMLHLNMSLNSGNSGGPLFDGKGRIIGVCTSTLGMAEQIAFAVPSFCILNYFQNFYTGPYGRFPKFGFKLLPMTQAYKKVHGIRGTGAVVHDIHPKSSAFGILKEGDVIHSVGGNALDMFGLMKDSTRGSKITIHNTEFILGLQECKVVVSTKSRKRTVPLMPRVIIYGVAEHFKEWNPIKVVEFGPFIFQNLSTTIMSEEGVLPACKNIQLLESVRRSKSVDEIVIISKIDPNSYVASFEKPEEFDEVLYLNRSKIKSIKDLKSAIADIQRMHSAGEKYFSIKTNSGEMWFTIDKVMTKKRKRSDSV